MSWEGEEYIQTPGHLSKGNENLVTERVVVESS